MRDAANLWAALRDARGVEGRDSVWSHPDLVPTSADLDDPLGFVTGDTRSESEQGTDFDAALEELLKGQTPAAEGPEDKGPENEGTEGGDNSSS
jgi:hypothetical protein